MEIRVEPLRLYELYKTKGIQALTPEEKEELNKLYSIAQNNMDVLKMDRSEYRALLTKRPLLRYRPLKNSFVKSGDKKLLATGLDIDERRINKYIENIVENNFDINSFNYSKSEDMPKLTEDKMSMVKDYVYRHGTKEQVLRFLENELSDAESLLRRLYSTLKKESGGIYDYFERPCHLLDNRTAHKMHTMIKFSLDDAQNKGFITEDVNKTACEWTLKQIYSIQSNQKLREALKIVKYSG